MHSSATRCKECLKQLPANLRLDTTNYFHPVIETGMPNEVSD